MLIDMGERNRMALAITAKDDIERIMAERSKAADEIIAKGPKAKGSWLQKRIDTIGRCNYRLRQLGVIPAMG